KFLTVLVGKHPKTVIKNTREVTFAVEAHLIDNLRNGVVTILKIFTSFEQFGFFYVLVNGLIVEELKAQLQFVLWQQHHTCQGRHTDLFGDMVPDNVASLFNFFNFHLVKDLWNAVIIDISFMLQKLQPENDVQ